MATHSSVLVWRIPWTEEAGEVQSIGSQTRLKWLSSHAQCVIGQRILRPPGLHPLQLHPSCTLRGYYREETILALHSPSEAREVASVVSDSVRPHRRQPTRLYRPWDSPGKNTGVGCHFLLQCMKVKSESEVAQLCPTLSDPMDCSLPGSSIHGIFQARVLEWGAIAFSGIYT